MKKGEFKKILKEFSNNKIILYVLFVIAFINLLSYLQYNCLGGIIVFLFIGLLTFHFTKNMIIILLCTLIITNILVGIYSLCSLGMKKKEGFKEGNENGDKKLGETQQLETQQPDTDEESDLSDNEEEVEEKKALKLAATNVNVPETTEGEAQETEVKNINPEKPDPAPPKSKDPAPPKPKDPPAQKPKPKSAFTNYRIEEDVEMPNNPNSLENVKMMEDVQNQLKELVGGNGLQNLDTAELLKQQKDLMKAIKQMEPLIAGATGMMDTFKRLPFIGGK